MKSGEAYTIRKFQTGEELLYKTLRLEALREHPGVFGNSLAMEEAFPDDYWSDRIVHPDKAIFGLFANDEPIGITGILRRSENPEEAYLSQSYIRLPWRGKRLSRLMYAARLAWAREAGIRRLIISHREDNFTSKAANQRFGFRYTHKESRDWPDGSTADNLFYCLDLVPTDDLDR